jgi:hypothetical protein
LGVEAIEPPQKSIWQAADSNRSHIKNSPSLTFAL